MSFQIIADDIAKNQAKFINIFGQDLLYFSKVDTVQLTDPIIIGVTGTNKPFLRQAS